MDIWREDAEIYDLGQGNRSPIDYSRDLLILRLLNQDIPYSERLSVTDYFSLSWGEPYRLLFPLGVALGFVGVGLWPLFYTGWFGLPYPVPHHAHIMIQGFFGSFVFGFMGTAMPRMLTAPKLTAFEVSLFIVLLVCSTGFHVAGKTVLGNSCFLVLLVSFVLVMRPRFVARQDVPPPGFLLVIFGWVSAFMGTLVLLLATNYSVSGFWYRLAQLLLFQGFLLFPILGIGAFLFPRFFGLPNLHNLEESRTLPPGWKNRAYLAAVCGILILVSFILEARGLVRSGPLLRLGVAAVYLGREVPFFRTFRNHGTLGVCLGTALLLLLAGLFCQALFPQYGKAMEHIVFMGGFGLLTATVATRVILGHSGQSHRLKLKMPLLLTMMILVILALLTRISADVFPKVMVSHQIYAAGVWIIAVGIWAVKILPGVLIQGEE